MKKHVVLLGDSIFDNAVYVSSGQSVIDLRPICDQQSDYAEVSPIEPSGSGGAKIAGAIAGIVEGDRSAVVSSVSV
ncbi:MAG: hypothetical protein KAU31_16905 [Spirochaetaceae bacterium]|nr:hypothetical protein [Spirochaetaceae bacterium]